MWEKRLGQSKKRRFTGKITKKKWRGDAKPLYL
jgi:hypothetical protein